MISRWVLNAQAIVKIVAFVKRPEDVAPAFAYPRDNCLSVTVYDGGHSTSGASSTEGLMIDLSRHLNTMKVNSENRLVYVGRDAIGEKVDKPTIQWFGLRPSVAGTVNHVGCTSCTPQAFNLVFLSFIIQTGIGGTIC